MPEFGRFRGELILFEEDIAVSLVFLIPSASWTIFIKRLPHFLDMKWKPNLQSLGVIKISHKRKETRLNPQIFTKLFL